MTGLSVGWATLTGTWALPAALMGLVWGIIGGALPGISASITIALLLPFTFGLDPTIAIIMLASAYVGAEYGGSIPAILIRTPGTNSAAATAIDGYEMHKQGRSGEALGLSLVAGTIGGLIGIFMLILLAEPLADIALAFTPPAYFSLGLLGLSVIATLSEGSMIKGFITGTLGLMIASVGPDPVSGVTRFTYDSPELLGGIRPIVVMIGIFAVAELLSQAGQPPWDRSSAQTRIKLPSLRTLWSLKRSLLLGSGIGVFEGVTPGAGGTVAAFLSYNEAKRWSANPELFGKGSPEAIVAPEAANNTVAGTALVPTMSFGIPGSNSTAILLGGMLLHGLQPGPMLFEKHPDFVYGVFSGLVMANLLQFPVGIIILTPCIWLVNRPKPWLMSYILALVLTGVYAVDHSLFDVALCIFFGVLGYLMRLFGYPFLPMVLGVILGRLVESQYRRALAISGGEHAIFVTDPISLGLLIACALLVSYSLYTTYLRPARDAAEARPESPSTN